jgi:hypothetical protein
VGLSSLLPNSDHPPRGVQPRYQLRNSGVGEALNAGKKVDDPPCDLYASEAALVPIDDGMRAFLARRGGGAAQDLYAVVDIYNGPCQVTTGDTVLGSFGPKSPVGFETGRLVHDTLLGEIWFADDGAQCSSSILLAACDALR